MTDTISKRGADYLRLLVWSAVAGLGSSGLVLIFGDVLAATKGALLAVCLSAGIPLINRLHRRHLAAQTPRSNAIPLAIGGLVGLLSGLVLALLNWLAAGLKAGHDVSLYRVELLGTGPTILVTLLYGLTYHFAYALRWRFTRRRAAKTFWCIVAVGSVCGAARGLSSAELISAWPLVALFSGVPFAALWAWAVIRCDPAWTFERWQSAMPADVPAASSSRGNEPLEKQGRGK